MSEAKEGLTSCVSQHQALLDAVQDLTKDVVRVDAIPTEDIEKVRVRSDVLHCVPFSICLCSCYCAVPEQNHSPGQKRSLMKSGAADALVVDVTARACKATPCRTVQFLLIP